MYNLQNTATNEIFIKMLLHLRSSHTEASPRLTTHRIQSTLHREASIKKCSPTFKCTLMGKVYYIKGEMNCESTNIIY